MKFVEAALRIPVTGTGSGSIARLNCPGTDRQGGFREMEPLPLGVNTFSYIYTAQYGRLPAPSRQTRLPVVRDARRFPHFWVSDFSADDRREIPKILAGEGLDIISVNLPAWTTISSPRHRKCAIFTIRQWCELVDLAGEWRIPYVIFVPGRVSPLLPMPRQLIEDHWIAGMTIVADQAAKGRHRGPDRERADHLDSPRQGPDGGDRSPGARRYRYHLRPG